VNNGLDDQFKTTNPDLDNKNPGEYDGDLMPGDPGALPQGGGQGPLDSTLDGIPCAASMADQPGDYHVHAFVGIFYNGVEYALPDAIGMYHAGGDQEYAGFPNQEVYAFCYYYVHTHDTSGTVHMEAPATTPPQQSMFTLGNLLDIWGLQVSPTQFGPLSGPVVVYTSLNSAPIPCDPHNISTCQVTNDKYQLWNDDPHNMPLYSHEVVWILVGSGNPDRAHLPNISFYGSQ
jgi:hypothetical protein